MNDKLFIVINIIKMNGELFVVTISFVCYMLYLPNQKKSTFIMKILFVICIFNYILN